MMKRAFYTIEIFAVLKSSGRYLAEELIDAGTENIYLLLLRILEKAVVSLYHYVAVVLLN